MLCYSKIKNGKVRYILYIYINSYFICNVIDRIVYTGKRERGDGSETITDNYVPGKAVKEIENL